MTNKIKILHIANQITGKSDGIFAHLLMIFKNTSNQFEHFLYFNESDEANLKLKNYSVTVFSSNSLTKKIPIKFIKDIIQIIKKYEIDIIQTHSTKNYIVVGLLNIFLKRKHIYNNHGVFIFNKYYNVFEKIFLYISHTFIYIFNSCNILIAPSKESLIYVKKESKLFRKSYYYYNTAIEFNHNLTLNNIIDLLIQKKNSYFLVGVIARIEILKRIDLALKILDNLKNKKVNIFFIFMGDGPQLNEMINLSKKLKVSDRVLFLNYVTEAKNYIKIFDLLLFTSEWEGLPLTIWEAMYNAVPVVSSDVGGIKEILEAEKCGIVYPFGDIEKCSNILIDLLNSNDKLKELGSNGQKAILRKYNQKQFKEFFENLYIELVNEK